jgi:hypothetical protein
LHGLQAARADVETDQRAFGPEPRRLQNPALLSGKAGTVRDQGVPGSALEPVA